MDNSPSSPRHSHTHGNSHDMDKDISPSDIINDRRRKRDELANSDRTVLDRVNKEQLVRQKRIRDFVSTLQEVAGLIDASYDVNTDKVSAFYNYYKLQESLKSKAIGLLEMNLSTIADKYYATKVGKELSSLIGGGVVRNEDPAFVTMLQRIAQHTKESDLLKPLYQNSIPSNDILVCIKCTLFPYAAQFTLMLRQLNCDDSLQNETIEWFHDQAVTLAKDLAYNWNENIQYRDKEVIFQNVLDECCNLTLNSFKHAFIKSLCCDFIALYEENILDYLPLFQAIYADNDMGYKSHQQLNEDYLFSTVSSVVTAILSAFSIDQFSYKQNGQLRAYLLKQLDKRLAQLWQESSDAVITRFSAMSEAQQQVWLNSDDGAKPMPIEPLLSTLSRYGENFDWMPILRRCLESNELHDSSARKFALLWGMSNGICKTRS